MHVFADDVAVVDEVSVGETDASVGWVAGEARQGWLGTPVKRCLAQSSVLTNPLGTSRGSTGKLNIDDIPIVQKLPDGLDRVLLSRLRPQNIIVAQDALWRRLPIKPKILVIPHNHGPQIRHPFRHQIPGLTRHDFGSKGGNHVDVIGGLEMRLREKGTAADVSQGVFEFGTAEGRVDGDEDETHFGGCVL